MSEPTGTEGAVETTGPGISRRGLIGAASVIAVGNILSRVLGLVREQTIAATFGATGQTDAYVIARTVAVTLYDLMVGSVITAAFVPVFVQHTKDRRQLWRIVSTIFSLAVLVLSATAAVLALFPEWLAVALAGGWPAEQRELAAHLLRFALISVVFQGLAGVLTSVLYAQNRFTLPAFAAATYNAGIVVAVVFLSDRLGVEALVFGLVLGGLGQFLLQAAGLGEFWRAFRPRLSFEDPAVRKVLGLYGPVAAGMVVTIIGYGIDTNLASQLPSGQLSAKGYATTLIQFPLGLVGLATSFAVLPTLARFALGDEESASGYREALLFGLKFILLLMLPIMAGMLALATPLVGLVFERNAFQSTETALTAAILTGFLPQLPFTAIDYLLIAAFYARQNTKTPVTIGVVSVAIYLVVALGLIGPLGIVGLAIADAVKNSAHGLILLVLLRRAIPSLELARGIGPFVVRVGFAAAVMGGAVWAAWPLLAGFGTFIGLVVSGALGVAVYAVLLTVLRVPEAASIVALVRQRIGR